MGTHPIFESDFDCLTDRMSATGELRAALSALCSILEAALAELAPGTVSPELFRQAKNDEQNAYAPFVQLLDALVRQTLSFSSVKEALPTLNIATPKNFKSPAALLSIFGLLLHRLNFVDEQFRSASRTSDVLRKCAIAEKGKSPGKLSD